MSVIEVRTSSLSLLILTWILTQEAVPKSRPSPFRTNSYSLTSHVNMSRCQKLDVAVFMDVSEVHGETCTQTAPIGRPCDGGWQPVP